jgi:hypothetical protein
MPYLIIYNSNNEYIDQYNLNIISDKIHDILKINKYWKLDIKNNNVNCNILIEYGEYILEIINGYKKVDFKFNIFPLLMSSKPQHFNLNLVIKLLFTQNLKFLLEFISNYKKNSFYETEYNDLRIDDDSNSFNVTDYSTFNENLYLLEMSLINHFENPRYYNNDLDHYMYEEDLKELKHFGYFNLKFGDSDYNGLWSYFSHFQNLDVD